MSGFPYYNSNGTNSNNFGGNFQPPPISFQQPPPQRQPPIFTNAPFFPPNSNGNSEFPMNMQPQPQPGLPFSQLPPMFPPPPPDHHQDIYPNFNSNGELPINEPQNYFRPSPQRPNDFMVSAGQGPQFQTHNFERLPPPPPSQQQQPLPPPPPQQQQQPLPPPPPPPSQWPAIDVNRYDDDDDDNYDDDVNVQPNNMDKRPPLQQQQQQEDLLECIICFKMFPKNVIQAHVNSHFQDSKPTAEGLKCSICGKSTPDNIFPMNGCDDIFCKDCIHKEVLKQIDHEIADVKCPNKSCGKAITAHDLRAILSFEELNCLDALSLRLATHESSFVKCPSCGMVMEFLNAAPSASDLKAAQNETDASGRPLGRAAAEHRCRYRLRCRGCSTDFCAKCGRTPYHAGFTCEDFEAYGRANHCRYCHAEAPPGRLACGDPECAAKAQLACKKVLPCGHTCYGIAGERTHLPCLHEDCAQEAAEAEGLDGADFCNICYVEELSAAPAIRLECGHAFHYACVLEKLRKRWTASRITFGFMLCPLCKKPIAHPALEHELRLIRPIKDAVEKKALKRLCDLGLDKSDEITKPGAPFCGKPLDYAMHKFCYYLCYKCKEPYYGGDRACGAEDDRPYNPEELLCVKCNPFHAEASCKLHGSDYIEWKCRFCCNVAAYFCWGTTHFCEKCHKEAAKIARLPRDKLPPCTCGIPHPPNGEEFLLGCSLCRLQRSCYK